MEHLYGEIYDQIADSILNEKRYEGDEFLKKREEVWRKKGEILRVSMKVKGPTDRIPTLIVMMMETLLRELI